MGQSLRGCFCDDDRTADEKTKPLLTPRPVEMAVTPRSLAE